MHPKDRVGYLDKREVIYKISCEACDTAYCGQARRYVSTRIHEHQLAVKRCDHLSEVAMHYLDTGYTFEWDKKRIVCPPKKAEDFLRLCTPMIHASIGVSSWLE
ncbi:unnamed protein product [Dibothriocephalus latus]|uniref:GIY-YIG domain-containing protein n=1 Tax=Dibothriocephalus latus TaxID=60516 RepID=A0A3P6U8P3_DIBLA|nr:unnamed protein product [Dibothriocephalus latus]